ncbi:class I SAM-dependent methyltransferase [Paraflavitalea sp. CAU 1676]|uniref:class I SAM-dependent methyltransferase n=1 Tax=Paraflavitalea sp. CAU 1676 TaxID=3032598 RepID=UPI0023D9D234|nr:class I SAM-dependent methyltransferase [Paraflavitalea sp. CAU 1676]MDF2188487.1 class I SAM-dependent methyltransferase [Paraflavitalea sp. CAU 1676]
MIAKAFLSLTEYPAFRRIIWKPIYENLAKHFKINDWHFMNYGYAPESSVSTVPLHPKDEINRYPIQLYHFLAQKTDIKDKQVLEVGSGRGGGASYISRYLSPATMTGVDIARNAIRLARKNHQENNLHFLQGNAEKLPFVNESFDVIMNVESSHAYGSVPRFLSEVKRLLRPGGIFLCTDLRAPEGMTLLKSHFEASGLHMVSEENITPNVVDAIEKEDTIKQQRINQHIARWMRPTFSQFAGTKGSRIHLDLQSNALIYYSFVLQKKAVVNEA